MTVNSYKCARLIIIIITNEVVKWKQNRRDDTVRQQITHAGDVLRGSSSNCFAAVGRQTQKERKQEEGLQGQHMDWWTATMDTENQVSWTGRGHGDVEKRDTATLLTKDGTQRTMTNGHKCFFALTAPCYTSLVQTALASMSPPPHLPAYRETNDARHWWNL